LPVRYEAIIKSKLILKNYTGGYLNEHGNLNLERFQLILNELSTFEQEKFEEEYADSNWFKGKQHKHIDAMEMARKRAKLG
jgi:5'-3' exoribonuclease 1